MLSLYIFLATPSFNYIANIIILNIDEVAFSLGRTGYQTCHMRLFFATSSEDGGNCEICCTYPFSSSSHFIISRIDVLRV